MSEHFIGVFQFLGQQSSICPNRLYLDVDTLAAEPKKLKVWLTTALRDPAAPPHSQETLSWMVLSMVT